MHKVFGLDLTLKHLLCIITPNVFSCERDYFLITLRVIITILIIDSYFYIFQIHYSPALIN